MNPIRRLLPLLLVAAVHPVQPPQIVDVPDRDADALVAAIHRANQSREATTIRLAEGGLYTLVTASDERRELGLPAVTGNITILGNNADLRRYSDEDFALLAVADGGRLKLERLTLAEGSRGALVNRGELELDRVRIVDNIAKDVPVIVENYGRLRVHDSDISYNQIAGTQRDAGTVLTMEPPYSLDPNVVRNAKMEVLRCLRPIVGKDVEQYTVRAQYAEAVAHDQAIPGYRREKGVSSTSTTETFVAVKTFVENWRWAGVPFYLRTGKPFRSGRVKSPCNSKTFRRFFSMPTPPILNRPTS